MIKQIQLSRPSIGENEWYAIKDLILNGWLVQGPKVKEFEDKFSNHLKVPYSAALSSCTTALHLSLLSAGIGPDDEVIVPSFSWVSTANAVEYCGARPVFIDVCKDTFNIDSSQISKCLSKKTKAILPVHLFGLPADMDAIKNEIPNNVIILEDAACAAGAMYKGTHVGSFGQSASFSFHPRKSITTGEGGMITTFDKEVYDKIIVYRNHGLSIPDKSNIHTGQPYDMGDVEVLGYNYRMTDFQAAIGLIQLEKMEKWIDERAIWAKYYQDNLSDISWLKCPEVKKDYKHSWQAFVTYIDEEKAPKTRNEIMMILKENGIATRPGTQAIHMLSFYKNKYNIKESDFPNARDCFYHSMAIPMHNEMKKDDYDLIIEILRTI